MLFCQHESTQLTLNIAFNFDAIFQCDINAISIIFLGGNSIVYRNSNYGKSSYDNYAPLIVFVYETASYDDMA